jgi:hypothetical protein
MLEAPVVLRPVSEAKPENDPEELEERLTCFCTVCRMPKESVYVMMMDSPFPPNPENERFCEKLLLPYVRCPVGGVKLPDRLKGKDVDPFWLLEDTWKLASE